MLSNHAPIAPAPSRGLVVVLAWDTLHWLNYWAAREWRNRQTRTVQVRVPERAWGFNSPLEHHMLKENRGNPRFSLFMGSCLRAATPVFNDGGTEASLALD